MYMIKSTLGLPEKRVCINSGPRQEPRIGDQETQEPQVFLYIAVLATLQLQVPECYILMENTFYRLGAYE